LATLAVSCPSIKSADIVLTQVASYGTLCYVGGITITEGTGFIITLSAASGAVTVNYAVFHVNA
jgi:hypothetical protein